MNENSKQKVRDFMKETLEQHGDHLGFSDDESLFSSGRLDSFSMMNLVMFLEKAFSLDFSDFEFDVALVDSVKALEKLIDSKLAS